MQHSQNIHLQFDFQSRSVKLHAVENVVHYFHEIIYLFISLLLFIFVILLKIAVAIFFLIHLEDSYSIPLKLCYFCDLCGHCYRYTALHNLI